MSKYKSLISPGLVQSLSLLSHHQAAPFTRRLMAGGDIHSVADCHVAVHEIRDLDKQDRDYCEPHRHSCGELNLLLSFGHLRFRITLGDEIYFLEAPASIFIPPGLLHSANAIEGSGFFVAIVDSSDYESSFAEE